MMYAWMIVGDINAESSAKGLIENIIKDIRLGYFFGSVSLLANL